MARLIGRKLLLILLLLPILNLVGFFYAVIYRRIPLPGARPGSQPHDLPSYRAYLDGLLAGDLGRVGSAPISSVLAEPIINSLLLLAAALTLIVMLGPLLGALAVSRQTRRIRSPALIVTTVGQSVPGFVLGVTIISLMLLRTFSSGTRSTPLPLSGFGLDEHLILPVLVLAIRPLLQVVRVTSELLEHELQQEYIRVARGKGLSWRSVYWRHALPNIVAAVVVTLGQSARLLISGLIIVETLFLWPGVGRIFMQAVGIRADGRVPLQFFASPDLIAALAVLFGGWLLLADLVTSIAATWADPRLRHAPPQRGH